MQANTNGNLLEIIDLANSLRQEHLFIANEQNAFNNLNDTLKRNSSNVAQVSCSVCVVYFFIFDPFRIYKPETIKLSFMV